MNKGASFLVNRIAIIGNGGGGKTTLSLRLRDLYQLPLFHVDSVQYLAGMQVRDVEETREILNSYSDKERWIIDGFGPIDVMEKRFNMADMIVFVDFPLWRHYWWCSKRQVKSIFVSRVELPDNCHEGTLSYTVKLFKILWRVHDQIRPQLLEWFGSERMKDKVIVVKRMSDWNSLYKNGLNSSESLSD